MKHERVLDPVPEETAGTPPSVTSWYVYTADRHLVATYAQEAAAASHVAAWPALYYTSTSLTPPAPLFTSSVPS